MHLCLQLWSGIVRNMMHIRAYFVLGLLDLDLVLPAILPSNMLIRFFHCM